MLDVVNSIMIVLYKVIVIIVFGYILEKPGGQYCVDN